MGELPSVCVIGAGVSGLTACKALADFGVPHSCFEASDEVGGNWYFQNPNGVSSAYRSLHIDISKPSISFRDFPMPDRYPDYPHHTHIFEWLRDYADAFALRERIRFNTRVEHAERGPQRRLADHARRRRPGELRRAARLQRAPLGSALSRTSPGPSTGPQIHSHDYVDPSTPLDLYGKRVLVVGIGNSAVDIVSELARKTVSDTVFLSTRSGAYVVPKYIFGKPADQVVKTNPRLPTGLQRRVSRLLPRIFSGRMEDFGLPTPNHNFLDAHPTVSSELLGRLGAGDAVAKGDVAELLGDRVRFADGSVEPVDAIIYATGYNVSFPFFDPGFLSAPDNVLPLYKRMLKPGLDDLAFIGLGQPIPTIFPFSELQSKLAARWLSGDWAPPARGRDGSGDPPRRGVPHGPLHRQAPPHDAARVVRLPARAQDALDPGRAGACARRRAHGPRHGRARGGARGRRSSRHERGLLRQRRACAAPASTCPARATPSPASDGRRPCVVLAHGFAGTVDSGLLPFAERFAAAGIDALAFDYRHFGASDGEPRQLLSIPRQLEDYAAAIAFARSLDGRRSRSHRGVGLLLSPAGTSSRWPSPTGASPAVISQVPGMDGAATLLQPRCATRAPASCARLMLAGLRDLAASLRGRPPVMVPVVGPPGSVGAMTTPDAEPGLPRDRRALLAQRGRRAGASSEPAPTVPGLQADRLPCPILVQIADRDAIAPVKAAQDAAWRATGRAEVRTYPIGHFDIYLGAPVRAGDRRPAALPCSARRRASRHASAPG